MEGEGADVVAELGDKVLLDDVEVCPCWPGGFGGTGQWLREGVCRQCRWHSLFGYLALSVAEPIDLAGAELPLVANGGLELRLGETWRQAAQDKFEAGLGSFGATGRLRGAALVQDCDGQDAVDARLRGHWGCSLRCGGGRDGARGARC